MLFFKALLVLSTATAVLAKGRIDGLVSGACLIGQDPSKQDSHGEEVFRNPSNHPAAVASILRYSADRADFHPRQKGVITDERVYNHFVDRVYEFPGFKAHREQNQELDLKGDRQQFREEVSKKYKSKRNNPQMMARAFDHLLPRRLDQDGQEYQEWLLNYVVMNSMCEKDHEGEVNKCDIEVEISSIRMKLGRGQKNEEIKIKPQKAEMTMRSFSVKKEFLEQHASELARRIRTMRTRDALEELATNGQLGVGDDDEDNEDPELEAWFQGFFTLDYLPHAYPISRWNVQF